MTQSMLDGYAKLLEKNPKDYLSYYERATQYYRLSMYDQALSDVKKALEYTPAKDSFQLASEYSLLSDIYTQLEQYNEALTAANKALELNPKDIQLLYAKGNLALRMNDLEGARAAFTAIQRQQPRNAEAVFGLARIANKQGQPETAQQYLKDAESLAPANYLTYCRLGDIHTEMGDYTTAAADYLNAFSLANNSERPLASLLALSREHFDAVESAIDYALTKTQNTVPLYFILGNGAIEAGQYGEAYEAFRQLLATPDGNTPEIQQTMAEICLHRGDLSEADTYASRAVTGAPTVENNLLKARIEAARGNYASSLLFAKAAIKQDPDSGDAYLLAANAEYQRGNYPEAIQYLNEAIMINAEDWDALMFRGYMQHNGLGGLNQGNTDFRRVMTLNADTPRKLTYRAIAQQLAGFSMDASSTISAVASGANTNPQYAYLTALYNAACGNIADAKAMEAKASELGFDDDYLLKYFNVPLISLAAIRE